MVDVKDIGVVRRFMRERLADAELIESGFAVIFGG